MLKKITLMAVSAVAVFAMNSASININNEDLELNANLDVGQFNENVEPETMFVGVRFLDADNANRVNNEALYEVSFLMKKEVGESDLSVGLGIKANYTKDYRTLPLGIVFEYALPSATVVPMALHADVYYAPKVLSFDKANKYFEYRVECDAEVIDHGHVVLGYRHIRTDYDDLRGNFTYNASGYIGFKFEF
ncbi:YfaZ family protein [Sulfurimonas sp. NW15]|uniref:YfaZ family outer membrane protein n=1 Tax=unclassified Sulfurimonas TaxID=2623549 RepID=UPI0032048AAF